MCRNELNKGSTPQKKLPIEGQLHSWTYSWHAGVSVIFAVLNTLCNVEIKYNLLYFTKVFIIDNDDADEEADNSLMVIQN